MKKNLTQLEDELVAKRAELEALVAPLSSAFNGLARELQCAVCLSILKEPHSADCGHVFCRTCALSSIQAKTECPTCRKPVSRRQLKPDTAMDIAAKSFNALRLNAQKEERARKAAAAAAESNYQSALAVAASPQPLFADRSGTTALSRGIDDDNDDDGDNNDNDDDDINMTRSPILGQKQGAVASLAAKAKAAARMHALQQRSVDADASFAMTQIPAFSQIESVFRAAVRERPSSRKTTSSSSSSTHNNNLLSSSSSSSGIQLA